MNRTAFILVTCALLAACAGGKAVRVDCDGPFTLINPVVAQEDGEAVRKPSRSPRTGEAGKP